MSSVRLTIPHVYMHDCDRVVVVRDEDGICVEIRLGNDAMVIDVFGSDSMPVLTVIDKKDDEGD